MKESKLFIIIHTFKAGSETYAVHSTDDIAIGVSEVEDMTPSIKRLISLLDIDFDVHKEGECLDIIEIGTIETIKNFKL